MKNSERMETLLSVIQKLKARGNGNEFRMDEKGFICDFNNKYYKPGDLEIIKTYRFEGESDPADSSILYVIRDLKTGMIGFCTSVYGAQSDNPALEEFIKKIPVRREEEIFTFPYPIH